MKAAVCRAFGEPLTIENVTIAAPQGDELEVAIRACAICHSDIAYAEGKWGGALPAVYGHEAAGVVVDPGGSGFRQGESVLVTLIRSCGACPACSGGQPSSCDHTWDETRSPLSDRHDQPLVQGMKTAAFAESVVVAASQCVSLPEELPFDVASLLACGVITGVGAVINTACLRPGQTAVIIGAGGVGLNAIQGARLAGAARIIAVDVNAVKLAAAAEFGATDGLLASAELADQVRALTGGRGADHVFVTVGAPRAFQSAPDLLAMGGRVTLVGMTGIDDEVSYKPVNLAAMNQSLLGSRMGQAVIQRDIPWLIEQYRQGRLLLDELISGRYRLEQINEAIADTLRGESRRNVIVFE